jgi:hypothetical protein
MCHTPNFNNAALEERLVTREVISYQLTRPAGEEAACMLAAAAVGKVVNHRRHRIVLRGAVTSQVRAMRATESGLEHRHRSLICVQDLLGKQCRLQR